MDLDDDFEQLVREALESLPEEFAEKLNNVEVVIEDLPSRQQLRSVGLNHPYQLLGLYQGVPQTKRGNYSLVSPDKISIFKLPLLAHCRSADKIKARVRSVVLHEIGHHFGMSEAELAGKLSA